MTNTRTARSFAALAPMAMVLAVQNPSLETLLILGIAMFALILDAFWVDGATAIAATAAAAYAILASAHSRIADDPLVDPLVLLAVTLLLVRAVTAIDPLRKVLAEMRSIGALQTFRFIHREVFTLLYVLRSFGRIRVGARTTIDRGFAYIGPGRLIVGSGTYIGCFGVFHGACDVRVGSNTYIGHRISLGGANSISIGNECMIANNVTIIDNDHGSSRIDIPMREQGFVSAPVRIEDDCWIGTNAIILKGVTVGAHSIVAAGAVVRTDVEPYSVVGGVPARLLKKRLPPPVASPQR